MRSRWPGTQQLVLGAWSERHIFMSIVAMVALGAMAAIGFWSVMIGSCIDDTSGWWFRYICSPMKDQPPWTMLTGLAAGPALLLTWYWKTKQRFREIQVSEYQEVTSRFARAVELLGSDNLAQTLGGIYALGRLAEDSKRERTIVFGTLCAYVRSMPSTSDLVVGRPPRGLGEREARLEAALRVLSGIRDGGALLLFGAQLDGLDLRDLDLSWGAFSGSSMRACKFFSCKLSHAAFGPTDLTDSILQGCLLENAILNEAILCGCDFYHSNMAYAAIAMADLRGARFSQANLAGADMRASILSGADLSNASLSSTDLVDAQYDETTTFPAGFDPVVARMRRVRSKLEHQDEPT
jgi:hypothetical protein